MLIESVIIESVVGRRGDEIKGKELFIYSPELSVSFMV